MFRKIAVMLTAATVLGLAAPASAQVVYGGRMVGVVLITAITTTIIRGITSVSGRDITRATGVGGAVPDFRLAVGVAVQTGSSKRGSFFTSAGPPIAGIKFRARRSISGIDEP